MGGILLGRGGGPGTLPAPPAQTLIMGVYPQPQGSETREQAVARVTAACGALPGTIRQYDHSNPTPTGSGPAEDLAFLQACTAEWANSVTVFVGSFRLSPTGVTASTYDSALISYFNSLIARGVYTIVIYNHEFDGSKYGLKVTPTPSFTLAQMQAAQAHIWTLLRGLTGNALIDLVVCYTGYEFAGAGNRFRTYQPGFDGYCNGVGWDLYEESNTGTMSSLQSANLNEFSIYTPSVGGPIYPCLPEVGTEGLTTAGINNFYSTSSLAWLTTRFRMCSVFDDDGSPYQLMSNVSPANTNCGALF